MLECGFSKTLARHYTDLEFPIVIGVSVGAMVVVFQLKGPVR